MTIRPFILASALVMASVSVFAQESSLDGAATPRVDQRQARQEQRIDQGVASGALTRREAHRLQHQQGAIHKAESRAKSDGTVSKAERIKLHKMQDHASDSIRHQKHDRQQRQTGGN